MITCPQPTENCFPEKKVTCIETRSSPNISEKDLTNEDIVVTIDKENTFDKDNSEETEDSSISHNETKRKKAQIKFDLLK